MKKKTYMAPAVTVTAMESMTIMAGSLDPSQTSGTITIGDGSQTVTEGWADAKRYDVWAEDEEK